MTDNDVLSDPDVVEALKIIARGSRDELCPDCAKRTLPDGADRCGPCADQRTKVRKREWWNRQDDYRGMLADGMRPGEAAVRWLTHQLRRGPVDTAVLEERAADAGIKHPGLWRAGRRMRTLGRLVVHPHPDDARRTRWSLSTESERRDGSSASSGGGSSTQEDDDAT